MPKCSNTFSDHRQQGIKCLYQHYCLCLSVSVSIYLCLYETEIDNSVSLHPSYNYTCNIITIEAIGLTFCLATLSVGRRVDCGVSYSAVYSVVEQNFSALSLYAYSLYYSGAK